MCLKQAVQAMPSFTSNLHGVCGMVWYWTSRVENHLHVVLISLIMIIVLKGAI